MECRGNIKYKDLERFFIPGCMPVIGDPSSLGTRFMQVRVLSPRLNCNFQDMRTNVKAAASPAPNGIGLGNIYVVDSYEPLSETRKVRRLQLSYIRRYVVRRLVGPARFNSLR